jgi:hypothetical protein
VSNAKKAKKPVEKKQDIIAEGGITAILGLVLLQQTAYEVRIPIEEVEKGLPEDSGVQVYQDPDTDELVVRIASNKPREV